MKKIHYSWIICAGGTLLLFCTAGLILTSFSVYQPYILAHGGFTNTQGSVIITIRSLAALISFLFVEKFYRLTDIRLGVTIASVGAVIGFILFGIAHNFVSFCLAAAVAGASYGLGAMIPVSILIGRWFHTNRALALGICASGTGIAGIVAPPLVTVLIERRSLAIAFFAEAVFIAAMAVIIYVILRNNPAEKGLTPLSNGKLEGKSIQNKPATEAARSAILIMFFAVVLLGVISQPGYSHLSVLFKTEGFDSKTVAFLISFVGFTLTIGKIIFGRITDHLGANRSGFVFFGLVFVGGALCCFVGNTNISVALIAMFFLGLGLPLGTVGLSVFAADMTTPSGYGKMVKNLQIAYLLGSLVFGPVPGMIADATGTYIPFYALISIFALTAMVLIQLSYRRMRISAPQPVATEEFTYSRG